MEKDILNRVKRRDYFTINDNFAKHSKIKTNLVYGKHNNPVPFITIMIPTYKRSNLLSEAIRSAIDQNNFNDYEIIVLDNDPISNDGSEIEVIIKSFDCSKIIYYRNEQNLGMIGNWNRCLMIAKSKWVCMLHDDDILLSDYLSTMVEILKKNDIEFLSCSLLEIDSNGRILIGNDPSDRNFDKVKLETKIRFNSYKNFNFGFSLPYLGAVFSREKAISIGGFDLDYSIIEDYFFVAKFAFYFTVYQYPIQLYGYRWGFNESLNLELWSEQSIHEYYLYKYISQKRNVFVRFFFQSFSKYKIITLVRNHNDGTSFLKRKCDIDENYFMKSCEIKETDLNGIILFISKIIVAVVNKYNSNINRKNDLNVDHK